MGKFNGAHNAVLLKAGIQIVGDQNQMAFRLLHIQAAVELQQLDGIADIIPIDTAVISIGQSPNPLIKKTTKGLETNNRGCIVADENGATSKPFVYAGGDVVTGAATVILAMGAGKTAAAAIHKELEIKGE